LKAVKLGPQQASLQIPPEARLEYLVALQQKVLWLAVWMIHHANLIRPKRDGLKVGGHPASCASLVTLLTALYFDVLGPEDRVAVKPHASPVFHAIQYLLGRQTQRVLEGFRSFGGAQSYPSRTKDRDDVDFSTGSEGLGAALAIFAGLIQEYVHCRAFAPEVAARGRMVALVGDAELDEGNIYEALHESWKHQVPNVWWVIDYNRQSLDTVVKDRLFNRIKSSFQDYGWRVCTLKYGTALNQAFARPGGSALHTWLDSCPNSLYSALVYRGGAAWREQLLTDIGRHDGIKALLDEYDDEALHALMTSLAGHDMRTVLDAFHGVKDQRPTCFIAYTVKGFGLPLAGHKDNHAGLMTAEQVAALRARMRIPEGQEWEPFAGLDLPEKELRQFIASVPMASPESRRLIAPKIAVPDSLQVTISDRMSTQEGLGRLLGRIALRDQSLAAHVLTASPDVASSTNLGPWVNRRGVFGLKPCEDLFLARQIDTAHNWSISPAGQHIELGIAENNLFLLLGAAGLSSSLFGVRLLPIGTVYDIFISRGLDALYFCCSQDARFIIVGTPSGVTLAPEGGLHQSVMTPLVGIGQPGLTYFEPAFVDELAEILRWSFEHLQADDGGSVYLRLSTRPLVQPKREFDPELARNVVRGAYWLERPREEAGLALVCTGPVTAEAQEALSIMREDLPGMGLLVVTSPDRLHREWIAANRPGTAVVAAPGDGRGVEARCSHIEHLLGFLPAETPLLTVHDGHPAALSWLGAVRGQPVTALGVERFGQCGDVPQLYREYGIDTDSIVNAAARLLLCKSLGKGR
jgi:pyruvate dehydrogenase E1 component